MTDIRNNAFYLESYLVQPDRNRVLIDGEPVQVEPKVMDVLIFLAKHPDEVLSRELIMNAVWGDTYVEEIALTRTISEIRKIFDDDARDPNIIETIHKRGYRLIADIRSATEKEKVEIGEWKSSGKKEKALSGNSRMIFITGAVAGFLLLAAMLLFFSFSGPPAAENVSTVPGTTLQGNEIDPTLAPDGSQLAFVWRSPETGQSDIYVKSLDAGVTSKLQLTNDSFEERTPAWSPRGNRIAFVRYNGDTSSIYVIPSLGGTERKVVQLEGNRYPKLAWSPEGKWIAFSDRNMEETAKRLHLINVDTKEHRKITLPPSRHYGDFHPVFSPDGNMIAFIRGEAKGIHDIFILDRISESFKRITFDHKRIGGLTFSHDGSEIIFSSDRGGTFSLWSISVKGGTPRWLSYAGERVFDPAISGNGTTLAYEKWHSNMDIWQMDLGGNTEGIKKFSPISSSRGEVSPEFSPDGERVAFVTSRSGRPQIWIANADGTGGRLVIDIQTPMLGAVKWSSDSRSIVFNSREGGNADIYTYNIETGKRQRITSHPANDISPNFSRDGKAVYFGSDRASTWQLYKADLDGNSVRQVTGEGGFFGIESANGEELYVSNANKEGIWRVNPDGTMERIVDDLEPHQWYNWQVLASGIYYIGRDGHGSPSLKKYSGGETIVIRTLPGWPDTPGFTISPDENRVLLTYESDGESDIIIARYK